MSFVLLPLSSYSSLSSPFSFVALVLCQSLSACRTLINSPLVSCPYLPQLKSSFANDEAFRKAMVKGKRDRATAKKKAKRPRKTFLETDSESNTSPHPSPAKSTYSLRLAMDFYLRLRHLTVTCIYPAFLSCYSCRHRRLVC